MRTESVSLQRIRRDGGTQLRQTMDLNATREYAEAMQRGEQFPAVVVYDDGESLWLSDGFHRYDAHVLCDVVLIECEIREGTRQDAILNAAKANRDHGVRLTPADREKIIVTLVAEFPDAIQADIARMAGMPITTVASVAKRAGIRIVNPDGDGRPRKEMESDRPAFGPGGSGAVFEEGRNWDSSPSRARLESTVAALPQEQREVFLPLLTEPGVPEDLALEAAENLAAMPEEKRARVAEMAASPKLAERQAAVGMMRGQPYVHPLWSQVNTALGIMRQCLPSAKGGAFDSPCRIIVNHLESLLEMIQAEERDMEHESD